MRRRPETYALAAKLISEIQNNQFAENIEDLAIVIADTLEIDEITLEQDLEQIIEALKEGKF